MSLDERIETLKLGRKGAGNRQVYLFEHPELACGEPPRPKELSPITQKLRDMPKTQGLEFVRVWDKGAITAMVLAPVSLSVVFLVVWILVSVFKYHNDGQALVTTAFAGATYVVAVGE